MTIPTARGCGGRKAGFRPRPERRWARLESARTSVTEARPGEKYAGNRTRSLSRRADVQQIPVKIPTSASKGTLAAFW